MTIKNIKENTESKLLLDDYDILIALLEKKENYEPPYKKNPFLKDYIVIGENIKIEFSTYNSKFRIISNKKGKTKIGQYDKYYQTVNRILGISRNEEVNTLEGLFSESFDLLRVGSERKRTEKPTIDDFPILNINLLPPNMSGKDSNRLKELIINTNKNNKLYDFDNSSGNGALFSPSVAMRFDNEINILISLSMHKVVFYNKNVEFQTIKINPNSKEYKELLHLIKKYY